MSEETAVATTADEAPPTETTESIDDAGDNQSSTVISSKIYDVSALRSPESIADLGRECAGLYHVFGTDMSRRGNLYLIEPERLIYATTAAVVLESTTSGEKEYLLGIDAAGIGCVTVHPSRNLFAVGGRGHQPNIYIYTYPALEIIKVLKGGAEKGYACLTFNAEGNTLASVSTSPDFMLTIWDWQNERMGLHSKAFGQDVFNVKFSEDDPGRLTTSGTGHIRFWKMASTFTGLKLQGAIGKFGKIDLSDIDNFIELPDGKVISGTETGSLLLWEGNFIKCRLVRKGGGLCHSGVVEYVNFDRAELSVISAAQDGYIRWWSFQSIDNAEVDSDHSMDFEIEPIAELYLGAGVGVRAMVDSEGTSRDSKRTLVVLDTLGRLQSLVFAPHEKNPVGAIILSETVKSLAGPHRESVQSVKTDSETLVDDNGKYMLSKKVFEKFHAGAISGMDTCPMDHLVATCSYDGTVRCMDYAKRKLIGYRKFDTPATCLRWLPSSLDATGKLIVVGFADGIVRVLGLGDNEEDVAGVEPTPVTFLRKMVFKPHNAPVLDLAFSLSSATLATAGKDGIIFFFDSKPIDMHSSAWRPVRFVTIDPDSVAAVQGTNKAPTSCTQVSWSPNGTSILTTCTDGVVREIETKQLRTMQATHTEEEITTFEEFFPIKKIVCNVPVMAASKSTNAMPGGSSPTKTAAAPTAGSESAAATTGENAATAGGDAGAEASSEAKDGAADGTAAAATTAPKSSGSTVAGDADNASVSLLPAKISLATFTMNRDPGSFLTGAFLNQKSYFFECNLHEESPLHELPSGVYSADGKDQMKHPIPTALRYGWSKNFLISGLADGVITVRPSEYLETFIRVPAHNGAANGASIVALSYDDRYMLSAGQDGTLVVSRLRLDKINDTAEPLYKDLEAGVYGDKVVKPDAARGTVAEPRYLSFVSTIAETEEDQLFSTRIGRRDGSVLDYPLMSAVEENGDVDSKAYSIQDNRLKAEEDAKKIAAEELKGRVRQSIEVLRQDYQNIVLENENIPEAARLTPEQMLVDSEFFDILKQQGREMVEEVHRECAHDAEKAEKLLQKMKKRLMDGLLMEEAELSTFLKPHPNGGRVCTRNVRSLRTKDLDPHVSDIMAEVHAMVLADELREAQTRTAAIAQRKANEAMDELMNRIHQKDDKAASGPATVTAAAASTPAGEKRTDNAGAEGAANGAQAEGTAGAEDMNNGTLGQSVSTDAANEFFEAESAAVARRQKRKQRKEMMAKLMLEKPNEDEDDIRDLNAITLAEKTTGYYKLKCADDYEVPEEQRINAKKKMRQMAMLEESMITMRLQFNDRFLSLRQLKLQMIYSIRRDNQRIREIDAALEQPEKSQDLWEPTIDPDEFPDDGDEITDAELGEYMGARKEAPWAAVTAPKHQVISGTKTEISKNTRLGTFEAKVSTRDDLLSCNLAEIPADGNVEEKVQLLSDPKLVDFTPPRTEPRRFYEVDDMVLKAYVRDPQSAEAARLRELEDKVPVLRNIKSALKARLHLSKKSEQQLKLIAAERRQLEFERQMILKKMDDNIAAFAEAVDDLRTDRHKVTADLKLSELKLLTLFQEFKLLQTFENRDAALQQKQVKCQNERMEIVGMTNENKTKLESKQEEVQLWNEKLAQITSEFKTLLPDNHPYAETLTKIFKKKVKRNKGRDADDDDDDYDDDDEDEDDDDDEEEVEDICPPGCDQLLFERLLDLREKKLDTEDVTAEIQKGIEDLRKTIDRLKQREKQIVKDEKQTEVEVQQFQLQKQAALNQISVVIPLRIGQLYMFKNSGKLTGPTDNPAIDQQAEEDPELQQEIATLRDSSKRELCAHIDLKSHVLFSKKNLVRLKERISELHNEIDDAKDDFKHLHRQRGILTKELEFRQKEIELWGARCRDLQMLKFGREIDLDELEATSDRTKELEAEAALKDDADKFFAKSQKLFKETGRLREQLAMVTRRNTQLLSEVANLTESKSELSKELNSTGQVVTHSSKLDHFKEMEEQKRISAYIKFQATELESLRTELNMLKRKEAPPLMSMTQQAPPIPGSPAMQQQFATRPRSREDIVLPPIPSAQK